MVCSARNSAEVLVTASPGVPMEYDAKAISTVK